MKAESTSGNLSRNPFHIGCVHRTWAAMCTCVCVSDGHGWWGGWNYISDARDVCNGSGGRTPMIQWPLYLVLIWQYDAVQWGARACKNANRELSCVRLNMNNTHGGWQLARLFCTGTWLAPDSKADAIREWSSSWTEQSKQSCLLIH